MAGGGRGGGEGGGRGGGGGGGGGGGCFLNFHDGQLFVLYLFKSQKRFVCPLYLNADIKKIIFWFRLVILYSRV